MPSITSWNRLEPRCRSVDMQAGLRAEVHDPLWFLARQWQLGKFQGSDSGSLVEARLDGECSQITRYRLGPRPVGLAPGAGKKYNDNTLPLETLVEREPVQRSAGQNLRLAAETGLQFLRLLEAAKVGQTLRNQYRELYPLKSPTKTLDSETTRLIKVLAGRVPDGNALYQAFHPQPGGPLTIPANPPVGLANKSKVQKAAVAWLQWYEGLISEPEVGENSWLPERMEYEFAVAAPTSEGELSLVAPEYIEGNLDWYSFDVDPTTALGVSAQDPAPQMIIRTVLPTPISFGGMPARRWWEFEDAKVDFGKIDAGSVDLARMLLIEFNSLYGNDHFVIPIDIEVGSICRIRSLVVKDNFGARTLIKPSSEVATPDGTWQMFHISLDHRVADQGTTVPEFLFLPPVLGPSLQSASLEEVLFLRDEMANLAWAIERTVEGPSGRPVNRFEAFQEQRRREEQTGASAPVQPNANSTAPLVYRLATSVPPHWIPLLPVQVGERAIRLQLREMYDPVTGKGIEPQGIVLKATNPLEIYNEEVPRAGARVTRAYQYARWIDGSTHLWIGRRKQPGRGEGSSGLRFDIIEPVNA